MGEPVGIQIMPYSSIIGQERLKLALELTYIAPRIGGVLISGQRGTGKSTAVRSFAQMMHGHLPVTLPINATEDRVVGGWQIDELMRGEAKEQQGLLEEAHGSILYVDEVNLLDDHIVNIILDVTSTGVLVVQREGRRDQKPVSFTLIGTMNPEEGGLRPQLLDRFGFMVNVSAETDRQRRAEILQAVLDFDEALFRIRNGQPSPFIEDGRLADARLKSTIERARQIYYTVEVPHSVAQACVAIAAGVEAEGHRGDYVTVMAARAYAALQGETIMTAEHVRAVVVLALQHRRPGATQGDHVLWGSEDDQLVEQLLANV
jgi:magnesium chelatase subunit I